MSPKNTTFTALAVVVFPVAIYYVIAIEGFLGSWLAASFAIIAANQILEWTSYQFGKGSTWKDETVSSECRCHGRRSV